MLETAAWVVTFVCIAAWSAIKVEAAATEIQAARFKTAAIDPSQVSEALDHSKTTVSTAANEPDASIVMGRLEVQSIGLTVPLLSDFDPASLRRGVGHIHGTAMPGGLGNMALAGHRDTFFRPLRNIKTGMIMSVLTDHGRYDYQVDSTEVVAPEDVHVLAIHDLPEMTLITCYPFEYVGSAPSRFIVRAHLKTLEPVRGANK